MKVGFRSLLRRIDLVLLLLGVAIILGTLAYWAVAGLNGGIPRSIGLNETFMPLVGVIALFPLAFSLWRGGGEARLLAIGTLLAFASALFSVALTPVFDLNQPHWVDMRDDLWRVAFSFFARVPFLLPPAMGIRLRHRALLGLGGGILVCVLLFGGPIDFQYLESRKLLKPWFNAAFIACELCGVLLVWAAFLKPRPAAPAAASPLGMRPAEDLRPPPNL